MEFWDLAIRLSAATVCGGLLGFEREQQGKPAGLRTHILVSIGAASFTLAALVAGESSGRLAYGDNVQIDPTRAIQGIVGGIGFLGAGAVLRTGGSIHGLTTAATVWVVGAVGIACGIGNYSLALLTSVLALTTTSVLGFIEPRFFADGRPAPPPTVAAAPGKKDDESAASPLTGD